MREVLAEAASAALPRILTQVCRDPGSPSYGCCDRDWWHYRIRDFPSVVLQQAGYALALAEDMSFPFAPAGQLHRVAAQTCVFWNSRAVRYGAFEEYYPYEQGYPPLAFSTLAVAKLCKEDVVPLADVRPGLAVAAAQLLTRFEPAAANQQIAGTAALAFVKALMPDLVPTRSFAKVMDRTLELQSVEGWFPEYDGPDLGYLSVAVDCLWDLFDVTRDERCLAAISAAVNYIAWFVLGPTGGAGILNSRNTDYLVPYGLVRSACGEDDDAAKASEVVSAVYGHGHGGQILGAVDDRYWCHYVGHSVFRAAKLLAGSQMSRRSGTPSPNPRAMTGSGFFLLGPEGAQAPAVLVAARKGAAFRAVWPTGQSAVDLGWIVRSGRRSWVSHWWSARWTIIDAEGKVGCDGALFSHSDLINTPWKHVALRIVALLLRRHLIGFLKRVLIFKPGRSRYRFTRSIRCVGDTVVVEDCIVGLRPGDRLARAPRSSKRHVASADTFHREDFVLLNGIAATVEEAGAESSRRVVTEYRPTEPRSREGALPTHADGFRQ